MDQVLIVLFQKPFRIPVQPAEWNTHLLCPPQQYNNNKYIIAEVMSRVASILKVSELLSNEVNLIKHYL